MFRVTAARPATWYFNLLSGRDVFNTTRDDLPSTRRPEDFADRPRAALTVAPWYARLAFVAVLIAYTSM